MIFKIIHKIKRYFQKKNYKYDNFLDEQKKNFSEIGLNRDEGLKKLNILKEKYKFLKRDMSSEHEIFFSSISLTDKKINNILEIGTFDGINSFLLSVLFPDSNIKTIDLPSTHENFKNFYNRKNIINKFINSRNQTIKEAKNVTFENLNSINLINSNDKYDLIWIDGAHGYPHVCIDIINSLKLINDQGYILCDDVFINKPSNQDKIYSSIASYETMRELENEKLIYLQLFFKRLSVEHNYNPKLIKYIGLITKY